MKTLTSSISRRKATLTFTLVSILSITLLASCPAAAERPAPSAPEATCPGGRCFTDVPSSNPFFAYVNNLYMSDIISGYPCGGAGEPCDDQNRPYYRPGNGVTRAQMTKFVDLARTRAGIHIDTTHSQPIYSRTTASGGAGVTGENSGGTITGIGVLGKSLSGTGVSGESINGAGVRGRSEKPSGVGVLGTLEPTSGESVGAGVRGVNFGTGALGAGVSGLHIHDGMGVYGGSNEGIGVRGAADGNGVGVYGQNTNASGYAGYFLGRLHVNGTLSKSAGSFKIDHPLDPANKYLYHSFVESPDMKDIYDGNVTTDASGVAVVSLPSYFQALNRDFRYQLTVLGEFAQAIVAEEIKDNCFTIKTDKPNVKVSWQVTGIRQDPYANQNRIPVEEDKPQKERGLYLHPELYGQPQSKGIDQAYPVELPGSPVNKSTNTAP